MVIDDCAGMIFTLEHEPNVVVVENPNDSRKKPSKRKEITLVTPQMAATAIIRANEQSEKERHHRTNSSTIMIDDSHVENLEYEEEPAQLPSPSSELATNNNHYVLAKSREVLYKNRHILEDLLKGVLEKKI